MPTYPETATTTVAERQALIKTYPCFSTLTKRQSQELAALLKEVFYAPKEVVVTQEELIDSVYFIVKGEAEVTHLSEYKKKKIITPIGLLQAHDSIGLNDTGFYSTTGKRTATVTAISEFLVLALDLNDLHDFLKKHKLKSGMSAASEQMLRMRLIKQSLPFSKLSHDRLQWLCERVENLSVPAGTVLFKEGDLGDKCYLVRSGKIEISTIEEDGTPHLLAILKAPYLFGEATLVTQKPRNATALALEDSQLLVLSVTYLSELWEQEQNVSEMFMTLMVDRSRPERNAEVIEYPRTTPEGQTIVVLKNPANAGYFKLSQEGWFIWQQLTGKQTLREITMALANQYQLFAPNMVAALISKLAHAGFVKNVSLTTLKTPKKTLLSVWGQALQGILDFRIFSKKADDWLTKIYNKGFKFLFSRPGQWFLAVIVLGGFFAFLETEPRIVHLLQTLHATWFIYICMLPLTLLTVALHELGHALGTKAFGRQVHSMGIGWNWTRPIAFTDTTDMWLDTRGHRILVNLAGPYANLFVAGLCSLLILVVPFGYMAVFLWLFALMTYVNGFAVLNPSQNTDGYFILMDFFEKPQLRQDATARLIKKFPSWLKRPRLTFKYSPEACYWLACLLYLVLTAVITFYVQNFVLKLFGIRPVHVWVALIIPVLTVVLSSLALVADIWKQQD